MKIIETPRRGGKTHQMLLWLTGGTNRVLIVIHHHEQERLRRLIEEEEWPIEATRILAASIAPRGLQRFGHDVEVALDNADIFLTMHFGRQIAMATSSDEAAADLTGLRRSPRFDMGQDDSREKE